MHPTLQYLLAAVLAIVLGLCGQWVLLPLQRVVARKCTVVVDAFGCAVQKCSVHGVTEFQWFHCLLGMGGPGMTAPV